MKWLVFSAFIALGVTGCTRSAADGPAEVKWDRDACRGCGMVLSEHDFAAEVRGGPKDEVQKFDDIGCAVTWLAKQPWGFDAATHIWVAKYGDGAWLDARTARYVEGKTSPMGFNFGAVEPGQAGLSFDEVKTKVLAGKAAH